MRISSGGLERAAPACDHGPVMAGPSAIIAEDEPLLREELAELLGALWPELAIVAQTGDGIATLRALEQQVPDVLFLDIQMPGLTGFDVLEQLDRAVPVIFTTAYDRYALEAFSVNSIDYLLKPVEPERLDRALDKLARFAGQGGPDVRALARELAAQLAPGRRMDRIASRVGGRTILLDVARVTHFFSKDKLTFAAVQSRDHVIDQTLNELEARLDSRRFFRIHRATIVNLAFVEEIYPGVEGMLLRVKDDKRTELAVARDRVRELKEKLGI